MLDLYTAGSFAPDATDPRNLFHQRALHEARIASEFRELTETRSPRTSVIDRVRAAFAGRDAEPATQACPCPA